MFYAEDIFNKPKNHIHRMPISEIDGLPVCVFINVDKINVMIEVAHTGIGGCCVPDKLYYINYPTIQPVAVEDVYNAIEDFTNRLDNLKLDRISGKLTDTPQFYPTECKFLKSPNIKSLYQECCVCYEITQTRTICKHPLCVRCWGQIPTISNPEGGDDDYEQPCPICRRDLQMCGNDH